MKMYDYLLDKYGYNEPIFTKELFYEGYSVQWIYKELNKLCKSGDIEWFDRGVCYIPEKTALGSTLLNPRKVIYKKYLYSEDEVIGYYSGNTLLNNMDLSTQMPNSIELCTNAEKSKLREVKVGNQSVLLRRSRTQITKDNVKVLQLLEVMNFVPAGFFDDYRKEKIAGFIRENDITRSKLSEYASFFPDKAFRNLVESEAIYSVAQ